MSLSEQENKINNIKNKCIFFISYFFKINQSGSILTIRVIYNIYNGIPNITVKTLTFIETILLAKNSELQKTPKKVLEELTKGIKRALQKGDYNIIKDIMEQSIGKAPLDVNIPIKQPKKKIEIEIINSD